MAVRTSQALEQGIVVEDVVEDIVVFGKVGEVVVAGFGDGEEVAVLRGLALQPFAETEGDELVFLAVDDEDGAGYFFDKLVGADLVFEQPADREDESVTIDLMVKAVIGGIQHQHLGMVPGGDAGGDAAAHRAAVDNDLFFGILLTQPFVYMLRIVVEDGFGTPAPAFAEAPVVDHEKIVAFADEVAGEFPPTFDAPGIALEVKDYALGIGDLEVNAVDQAAVFHFKIDFFKRKGVFVLEGLREYLGPKEKQVLCKIENDTQCSVNDGQYEQQIQPHGSLFVFVPGFRSLGVFP